MSESETKIEAATASAVSTIISSDVDDNYEFFLQHRGLEYTPEEEKKVLRKIDLHLIPILFFIYLLQVSYPPTLTGLVTDHRAVS
jgi:hypothetical protein